MKRCVSFLDSRGKVQGKKDRDVGDKKMGLNPGKMEARRAAGSQARRQHIALRHAGTDKGLQTEEHAVVHWTWAWVTCILTLQAKGCKSN